MSRLVDLVQEKNAEQFVDSFLEKISEKVIDCLEEEKVLVAEEFFNIDREETLSESRDSDPHVEAQRQRSLYYDQKPSRHEKRSKKLAAAARARESSKRRPISLPNKNYHYIVNKEGKVNTQGFYSDEEAKKSGYHPTLEDAMKASGYEPHPDKPNHYVHKETGNIVKGYL
jgi:hypothetical protein